MKRFLYGAMGIPFVLSQWTPFNIELKGSPQFTPEGRSLRIITESEAGGVAYFLKEPVQVGESDCILRWKWKVDDFPAAKPSFPLSKADADFPLRVGLLLSDGEWRIPLPRKFRKAVDRKGFALSRVLFYSAVRAENTAGQGGQCGPSPYHDKFLICTLPASGTEQSMEVKIGRDLKRGFALDADKIRELRIFGIWLFADSDNSKSRSSAVVSDIQFDMP